MKVTTTLMGGLGNCLFMIANCIAYSLKHGIDYCIPTEIEYPHYEGQKVFQSSLINYCANLKGEKHTYLEPFFHYQEIPKFDVDILVLQGYFQSSLYFDEYREEILQLLNIPYNIEKGSVAIHVRRDDYLLLPNCHPIVSLEYIHAGIDYFINLGYKSFVVFSDDFDFCYQNIEQRKGCTIGFEKDNTEIEDLSLASSCEHIIGCNSSFSWWIYYLNRNENKIGVFPKKDKWFGAALPHNVDDLYMPEWILI